MIIRSSRWYTSQREEDKKADEAYINSVGRRAPQSSDCWLLIGDGAFMLELPKGVYLVDFLGQSDPQDPRGPQNEAACFLFRQFNRIAQIGKYHLIAPTLPRGRAFLLFLPN